MQHVNKVDPSFSRFEFAVGRLLRRILSCFSRRRLLAPLRFLVGLQDIGRISLAPVILAAGAPIIPFLIFLHLSGLAIWFRQSGDFWYGVAVFLGFIPLELASILGGIGSLFLFRRPGLTVAAIFVVTISGVLLILRHELSIPRDIGPIVEVVLGLGALSCGYAFLVRVAFDSLLENNHLARVLSLAVAIAAITEFILMYSK